MADIRDHVRSNFGETYDKLTQVALYDGQGRPDVVGLKIAAALSRFSVVESDLSDFAKTYVAAWVTRSLIPVAIDYYMVQTRLSDNASRPAGFTPGGGEVGQNYDRINALKAIDAVLKEFLASEAQTFKSDTGTTSPGIRVSQHTRTLRTADPYDTFSKITRTHRSIGFDMGTVFVLIQDCDD